MTFRNPTVFAHKSAFALHLQFDVTANPLREYKAIELIVHHDSYERRIEIEYDGAHRYDTFVQYGTGIDFNEIEACFVDIHGRRSDPVFFCVGQPQYLLTIRRAHTGEEDVA